MVSFGENHFQRMGTLIAVLAAIKEGDDLSALTLDPALILKCKKPKVIMTPHALLVNTNPTGVINANYLRYHSVAYLQRQSAKTNAECIVIMDSTTAHIYSTILAAFRHAELVYAVIPGLLTMFVLPIDIALAALYGTAHHRLCVARMEGKRKPTAAHAHNLFVEFCL